MEVEGGCHRGAITYGAEVEPGTTGVRRCLDRRTPPGSAPRAAVSAPADTSRILTGTPERCVETADSGVERVHAFRDQCGAPVHSCTTTGSPPHHSLRVGALEQSDESGAPHRRIWTERGPSWVPRIADAPETDAKDQPRLYADGPIRRRPGEILGVRNDRPPRCHGAVPWVHSIRPPPRRGGRPARTAVSGGLWPSRRSARRSGR